MVGAVGDDTDGRRMTAGLELFGIDTSGVESRSGMNTGVAVILVEEDIGENRILLSPEANYSLKPEDFLELPAPLPALVILQLEIPLETVLQILTTSRRQKVPVLLNAVLAQKIPANTTTAVDHLVINESEAMVLSDCTASDLKPEMAYSKVAAGFKALGVETVLITLGGRGVFFPR